ncbi:MAG: right-handed parallel beta-helix repeat-containing protein [Clostridia bacterium]|nr:right-handed parallel beta-helix repeat-containing protein [Clostridia bacterium]
MIFTKYTTNSSGYDCTRKYTGGFSEGAGKLKREILNSKNTEEIYDIKGKKYYINRNMSLSDIPENLSEGDAVLFERGGLWRVGDREKFLVPEGVIFGAYGKGDKPKFYGSFHNYADKSFWEKESKNIWRIQLKGRNVGSIAFNETALLGVKKWHFEDLKNNYDFYYNGESQQMWLYYEGEPWNDFYNIEICQRGKVLQLFNNSVVDNLFVGYTGSHAIVADTASNGIKITNCEVAYVGGAMQFDEVRFGNGVEIQLGATNAAVRHNYVHQCYDAGITFQSWTSAGLSSVYRNMDISENLIEFCGYGIEYFTTSFERNKLYSEYENIRIADNIIRFSGYEWSYEQRPDKWMISHIRGGQWAWPDDCKGFVITGNVFDCSRASIIFWWWHDDSKNFIHPEPHRGLTVKGNTYFQAATADKRCMNYHINKPVYAENIDELKTAVALFDESPEEVVWVDRI